MGECLPSRHTEHWSMPACRLPPKSYDGERGRIVDSNNPRISALKNRHTSGRSRRNPWDTIRSSRENSVLIVRWTTRRSTNLRRWTDRFGITIGNPAALAVMVDISAVPGTNRPWPEWSLDDPGRNRIRILSLDMLLPIVDGERGARTRLTQIVEAAKRKKVCPGVWWHLPT